jgi:hypothetical protein
MLAIPAVLVVGTTASLALSLPLGPVPFLVWWWWRGRRQAQGAGELSGNGSTSRTWRTTVRGVAAFLVTTGYANGSLQLLLGVGPLILIMFGTSPAVVSAFFATAALARAPLVIAMGVVPRLLNPLTRRAAAGEYAIVGGAAWLVVAGSLILAACAGFLGVAFGPGVVGILFGDEFAMPAVATGAAAAAVVVSLGALALNQVLVAENKPERLVPAWTAGLLGAAIVVLALPSEPMVRVSVAMLAGQVVAILGLAVAIASLRLVRLPSDGSDG